MFNEKLILPYLGLLPILLVLSCLNRESWVTKGPLLCLKKYFIKINALHHKINSFYPMARWDFWTSIYPNKNILFQQLWNRYNAKKDKGHQLLGWVKIQIELKFINPSKRNHLWARKTNLSLFPLQHRSLVNKVHFFQSKKWLCWMERRAKNLKVW